MTGRTIVITGASDGIGAAAARALAARGERVVLVGRSLDKTRAVAAGLGPDGRDAPWYTADFARLDDVRELAATLRQEHPQIDVLANNAGGIMGDRELTVDGHEKTLQVNHLAPFLLTTLLIDRLVASRASVIATSSVAHRLYSRLDLDDLNAGSGYSPERAYGNAKLANILFSRELHARYHSEGVSAAAFHPGVVATGFSAGSSSRLRVLYGSFLNRFIASPEKGASTLVWLAESTPGEDWASGGYFAKSKPARLKRGVDDPALAAGLWERSAAMVQAG